MHGGMTRNELRALMALILLIAVGVGARQVARSRKDGRFWTEITPERNIAVERDVAPLGDGPGERAIHAGLAEEDPKSNPSGTREGGTDDETSATVPGGPGDEAREEAGGPVQEGTAGRVEEAPEGRVDLNAASADDLSALPQIGEKRAAAIIRLREGRGGFSRVEELLDVDGIGEKTLEKIRPFVWVAPRKSRPAGEAQAGSSPSPTATQLPARTPRPTPSPPPPPPGGFRSPAPLPRASLPGGTIEPAININSAGVEELEKLWNIGPAKARAIVEWRTSHGPFRTKEDLVLVPGIGAMTLQRNLDRITIAPHPSEK